jgi:hypothetical protein
MGIDEEREEQLYRFNYIRDLPFLRELKQFNEKGNFDRISSMRLYPYARMYYQITKKAAESNDTGKSVYEKIGLYGMGRQKYVDVFGM